MKLWTLEEHAEVFKLVNSTTHLHVALDKFCRVRAARARKDCAQAMQTVPRSYELAADYAAKAEVYDSLLTDLERECAKDPAGPTGQE